MCTQPFMSTKQNSPSTEELSKIWETITERLDADKAREVLLLFEPTSVASQTQLQAAANLTRERLNTLLERMRFQRLLSESPLDIKRPGARGRSPRVYLLAESGARLLSEWCGHEVNPSGLNDDTSILHALAMLDVHRAAVLAGQTILTDSYLPYGDGKNLRPDHLVTTSTGDKLIYEVEQSASPVTLRRVKESLEHKQAFFSSQESNGILPEVRMLVNLPRGKTWERTLKTWRNAIQVLIEQTGQKLAFRLLVMPLAEFLTHPDWETQAGTYWGELTMQKSKLPADEKSLLKTLPKELESRSSRDDRIVLRALWGYFLETRGQGVEQYPQPDSEFLDLMRLIHAASFDEALPVKQQAGVPYASIYLLDQYLKLHKDLLERLNSALHYKKDRITSNPTTILHRMQVVINVFLRYHGWRSDGPLFAASQSKGWEVQDVRTFGVMVNIRKPELLMLEGDGVVPDQTEVDETERALAWVLCALFEYSLELGLGRVDFW